MNFQGNWGYNKKKYIKIAEEISKLEDWDEALRFLFSDNSELGNWLRTKHVIEKLGITSLYMQDYILKYLILV